MTTPFSPGPHILNSKGEAMHTFDRYTAECPAPVHFDAPTLSAPFSISPTSARMAPHKAVKRAAIPISRSNECVRIFIFVIKSFRSFPDHSIGEANELPTQLELSGA